MDLIRIDVCDAQALWQMQTDAFADHYSQTSPLQMVRTGKVLKINDKMDLISYIKE